MRSAFIYGVPKVCCNTNCRDIFNKNCFLGWSPRNETEVYTILKCNKCKSIFKIAQNLGEAQQYYDKLPEKSIIILNSKITKEETDNMKKSLSENTNILEELNEGMIPGVSQSLKPKNDK